MARLASPTSLLFLSLFCLAPLVSAPPAGAVAVRRVHKEAKQEIADLEQQWRTATLNGDIALMDRLLSEDYVGISMSGQINTKSMQLDRLRKRTVTISRLNLSDVKIKLVGTVAIVTSRAEVDGTNEGAVLRGNFRYTRVYQRLPSGQWKITNFEATRIPDPDHVHHRQNDGTS